MKRYELQDVKGLIADGDERVAKVVSGGAIPKHFDLNVELAFGARNQVENRVTIRRCYCAGVILQIPLSSTIPTCSSRHDFGLSALILAGLRL